MVRIAGGLFMYNHTRRLPEIYGWVEQALALPDSLPAPVWPAIARLHRAYGMYMNNELAAAETEIRGVLAEGGDDSDPLKPPALVPHTYGGRGPATRSHGGRRATNARSGRLRPSAAAPTMTMTWPKPCGTDAPLPCSEVATDRAAANEYLQLARDLGNARALAGALLMSGMFDPDPRRGAELLAQARELTARTKDTWRHTVATLWLGVLADNAPSRDPQAAGPGRAGPDRPASGLVSSSTGELFSAIWRTSADTKPWPSSTGPALRPRCVRSSRPKP